MCLQCKNCMIHTWALQRRASHNGALYKSMYLTSGTMSCWCKVVGWTDYTVSILMTGLLSSNDRKGLISHAGLRDYTSCCCVMCRRGRWSDAAGWQAIFGVSRRTPTPFFRIPRRKEALLRVSRRSKKIQRISRREKEVLRISGRKAKHSADGQKPFHAIAGQVNVSCWPRLLIISNPKLILTLQHCCYVMHVEEAGKIWTNQDDNTNTFLTHSVIEVRSCYNFAISL